MLSARVEIEKRPVWYIFHCTGKQWRSSSTDIMEIKVFANSIKKSAETLKPYGLDFIDLVMNQNKTDLRNITSAYLSIIATQVILRAQIAAKVPCGLSTVVKTLKRFSETNFIADRGRSGQSRKTSLREDKLLHRISLSNRKLNSLQILKQWTLTSNVSLCPITVRGRLLDIGLRGCKARPKPLLTEFQRKRGLTWAREHSLWTIKDWENVIFSDESQFCIFGNQSSAYVRRRTHEEFSPQ
ncbi:transposable element Tc1 transposase [Trichonephila clavipes]|nr:transposable element Tc1 transposase [Trichonephila clavipes]